MSDTFEKDSAIYHMEEAQDKEAGIVGGGATLDDVLANNQPSLVGKGMLQLYLSCFFVYLVATTTGFDSSLLSSINALPAYLIYYDMVQTGAETGLMFSIFNVGLIAGSFFIWIVDYKGRKFGLGFGLAGVVVSTIVVATAKTKEVLIAGRFLVSFFGSVSNAAAPIYLVEVSPPHVRGVIAGLYNTFSYLGSIIAAFTILGCVLHHSLTDVITFRLPFWLQLLCPGISLAGLYFIPESPRWLIGSGQPDKARAVLVKYHANGDENHPLVDLEMAEMTSLGDLQLTSPKKMLRYFDIREFFRTRSDRYRTFIILCITWFGQFSGNVVISAYLPVMLEAVGITSTTTLITMNGVYAIVGLVFAVLGTYLHDTVGRRKVLITATFSLSVCMAVAAATTAKYQETGKKPYSVATIVFLFLFCAIFSAAYTSIVWIYPGEVSTTAMRSRMFMAAIIVGSAANFINQFVAPIVIKKIGFWLYVFFVFWDLLEVVILYFFFVETKGWTLEQLEVIFKAQNPMKASKKPLNSIIEFQ